jgi:hypothetical protein
LNQAGTHRPFLPQRLNVSAYPREPMATFGLVHQDYLRLVGPADESR